MPTEISDRPKVFLKQVHLKGYKSIEDLSVDFQKGLNILIGKNGSGKSNFLDFLYLAITFNIKNEVLYNYIKLDMLSNDNHSFTLELERKYAKLAKDGLDDDQLPQETLTIDGEVKFDSRKGDGLGKRFELQGKKTFYGRNLRTLFAKLGYINIYPLFIKFDFSKNLDCIATAGTLKGNVVNELLIWQYPNTVIFIEEIFWVINGFFDEMTDRFDGINKSDLVHRFQIPVQLLENFKSYTAIEDVRFNPNINLYKDEKSVIIDNIKLEFKVNGNWLPWSELSDGTKRIFYIIAEVTFYNGLILIEEPELGIHPYQFNLLMDFLKEQSEEKQIVISTHSPKALDHLSPEELNNILITYYDQQKATQIRHLTEKEIIKAKKYMKEVGFFSDYWLLSDLEE